MKTKLLFLLAGLFAAAVVPAFAEKVVPGPKGGRLLETEPLRAEFFVRADRRVEVVFYDATLKPTAPTTQVVAVTAEPKEGRAKLELAKAEHGFVSAAPLPAGEPYRVVVQVRATPEAKPQNFRVDLNLATCGGCARAEYACTCEGH